MDKIEQIEVKNQGYKIIFECNAIDLKEYRDNAVTYAPRHISNRREMTATLGGMIKQRSVPYKEISHLVKIYGIGVGYQNKPTLESLDRYAFVSNPKEVTVMQSEDTHVAIAEQVNNGVKLVNKEKKRKHSTTLPFISPHKLRPVQEKYVSNAIAAFNAGKERVLIEAEPGAGKTLMSSYILSKIGERYLVLIKGGYIDKWAEDIQELHGLDPFIIKGRGSFAKLIKLKEANDLPEVYLLSTNTLDAFNRQWVKGVNYLEGAVNDREKLLEFLECNIVLNDESHQYFSSTIEGLLQLDPRFILALSGTYSSSRKYRDIAMNQFFPPDSRLSFDISEKYIEHVDFTSTLTTDKNTLSRLAEASIARGRGYSHNALEQHMLNYKELIDIDLIHIKFIINKYLYNNPIYQNGDKIAIFVSSIAYAELLTYELGKLYNNVKKYTGNDSYENIMTGEVIITNVAKAGTAIDIKKLLTVVLTEPVGNKEGLRQVSKRLRKEYREGSETPYAKTFITKYINGLDRHAKHRYLVNSILKPSFTKQRIVTDGVKLPFKV